MTPSESVPVQARLGTLATASLVDWPAIIAGALIATATLILLTTFGAAIGLTATSPWAGEGWSASSLGLAGAVWFALTHIYSIGLGAYMAGRMRPRVQVTDRDEIEFRDGMTGLSVWAVAVILSVWFAASVVSGAMQLAGGAAASLSQGVSQGVGAGIRTAYQTPALRDALESSAEQIYRAANTAGNAPQAGGQAAAPQEGGQTAAPQADGQTGVSNQAGRSPATPITSQDRNAIMQTIIARLADGELSQADQEYISRLVANRTGMTVGEIESRVADAARTSAENVKAVVDDAREIAATTGFWTVFIIMISSLAAWWSGSIGGQHRDAVSIRRTED